MPRRDWTYDEVSSIYNQSLTELIVKASNVHQKFHAVGEVQICTLLSVKTGGCQEDCGYCSQSAKYTTGVAVHKLMKTEDVVAKAREAKAGGSSRFCMGAAWREVRTNRDFDAVLSMVKQVNALGLETCCTLGMLNAEQARQLKEAGLAAYNHNLDTGKEFYHNVVTTRTYEARLETLNHVAQAGIKICSGGILGLGEKEEDRISMLHTLATLPVHPESVPVNALVPIEGTPLENQPRVSVWEMLRMISTARILMPRAMVRLSAGRTEMTVPEQMLCFLAGANSIFAGDKLLTAPNPSRMDDNAMFQLLGLKPLEPKTEEARNSPPVAEETSHISAPVPIA
ncbi:MAG: biotin synthase BioB [Candidatus Nephrothrix sp. EaCA]|nr:MAG: biotin synthase BioB [Candidatus Nephrothrix sp. EaCA]